MSQGVVFDIKKFSIHDGPGIRTTVFLKGCSLHCAWCHNPEGISANGEMWLWENRCIACGECLVACSDDALSLVDGVLSLDRSRCSGCGSCAEFCPAGALEYVGRTMTIAQVMAEIERDVIFYDESGGGVTISGGEPLCQPGFLEALLRACQEREIHTVVDTAGSAPPEALRAIAPYVDLFLYDLKLMDDAAHQRLTGGSNRTILQNLRSLAAGGPQGHAIIVRLPIVPGITDGDENIAEIGRFVASLGCVQQVDILPYHRAGAGKYGRLQIEYGLRETRPPSNEQMAQIAAALESFGLAVSHGG